MMIFLFARKWLKPRRDLAHFSNTSASTTRLAAHQPENAFPLERKMIARG
jgi:hypothetical protein